MLQSRQFVLIYILTVWIFFEIEFLSEKLQYQLLKFVLTTYSSKLYLFIRNQLLIIRIYEVYIKCIIRENY